MCLCAGLKKLKLRNNLLTQVPDGALSSLSVCLTSVDLQHNPLQVFPAKLLLMRSLRHLNLEYTNIETLDFVALDANPNLTVSSLAEALKNPTTGMSTTEGKI
jgi:Leucine-rich repeat (LRR) protein